MLPWNHPSGRLPYTCSRLYQTQLLIDRFDHKGGLRLASFAAFAMASSCLGGSLKLIGMADLHVSHISLIVSRCRDSVTPALRLAVREMTLAFNKAFLAVLADRSRSYLNSGDDFMKGVYGPMCLIPELRLTPCMADDGSVWISGGDVAAVYSFRRG